jgi:hypothetical protein
MPCRLRRWPQRRGMSSMPWPCESSECSSSGCEGSIIGIVPCAKGGHTCPNGSPSKSCLPPILPCFPLPLPLAPNVGATGGTVSMQVSRDCSEFLSCVFPRRRLRFSSRMCPFLLFPNPRQSRLLVCLGLGFILCGSVIYRALTFFYEKNSIVSVVP